MKEKTIGYDSGGIYAEVFDDQTEKIGRWYGTRDECEKIDPDKVKLFPMKINNNSDPFDLACERRFD